jgi:hypothetical protein
MLYNHLLNALEQFGILYTALNKVKYNTSLRPGIHDNIAKTTH